MTCSDSPIATCVFAGRHPALELPAAGGPRSFIAGESLGNGAAGAAPPGRNNPRERLGIFAVNVDAGAREGAFRRLAAALHIYRTVRLDTSLCNPVLGRIANEKILRQVAVSSAYRFLVAPNTKFGKKA